MKHFAFTGTHSTGKTTVLEALQSNETYNNYKFYKSITRKVGDKEKLNTKCDSESQQKIIAETVKYYDGIKADNTNSIEDRCFIDTFAYTLYFHDKGLINEKTLSNCITAFLDNLEFHDHIFYFKTEFENVLDGVRIDDKDYRVQVENNIEDILERYEIDYTIISGTVEERVQQINEVIKCS